MKLKNRILSAVVTVITCFGIISSTAMAAGTPTIAFVADKTTVNPGDTIELKVNISNNPGLVSLNIMDMTIDSSVFTITGVTNGSILNGAMHTADSVPTKKKLNWYDVYTSTDYTDNGTLATLTLSVNESATAGTYNISATVPKADAMNYDMDEFVFAVTACDIKVEGASKPENKVQEITGNDSAYAGKSLHISPEMTFVNEAGSTTKIYLYKKGVADPKTYDAAETFAEQGIEVGSGASVKFNIAVISADTAADTFTFEIK